ncbi:hypothetical protein RM553_05530 [Zunongwangia sp. F363]|uniref:Uncharacterized protein n=1 Tax=Autumnicola tepida TaxID=3075595 RepID=A0ABU3C7G8_9FLAO|nr:hypothetical protein [Zunongwangia sp. F363]MDT0642290.1 hypothetical protein [Zunongwangia sp. F363]
MKINFLSSAGRPGLYVSLALAGLLFVNCSKDDDTPPTYDFEDQFEDLEELETVEDEDPEITEPDTGGIEESEKTTAIVADLGDGSGDVSAETQASLDAVENFSAGFSTEAKAEADALDANRAEEILNMTGLEGDLAAVATSLEDAPAEVLELLPSVDFGADLETFSVFNESVLKGFEGDFSTKNTFSQSQQSGPCFEAAQEAYDEAMAPAITKRQENIATIEANYQRRLGEAEARTTSRQANVDTAYDTYFNSLLSGATNLINYADSIEGDSPALASNIRSFALIYLVQASSNLTRWYNAASQKLEDKEAVEKQTAEGLRDTRTAEVEAKFAAIKATADAKLTAASNNCHNQGSGS